MIHLRTRLLLTFALILPAASSVRGQEQIFRHEYAPPGSDTFVEIHSVFGAAARHGSLPFRVVIRNNSGRERTWTVEFEEGNSGRGLNTNSTYRFTVPDGTQIEEEVVFTFAPNFLAYDYRNLQIRVSASGLPGEERGHGEQTNQTFPALAISRPLAQRSLTRLDDVVKGRNSGDPAFAKRFETAHLPKDWRGYTGLDAVLLDLPSWRELGAAQRQALVAWIRLGGRLDLYGEQPVDPETLGLAFDDRNSSGTVLGLSLGEVRLHVWNGSELAESVISDFTGLKSGAEAYEEEFDSDWNLQKEIGLREFNPTLVFVLLVVFAILVAPVNLFYFAKPGRRHRLFLTTPIISIATCVLIVLFILFFDGIGGRGLRVVLADLHGNAEEARLYVTQEQISRTGVMVRTGFEVDRSYDLTPVNLRSSSFDPFSGSSRRSATFGINGGRYEGGLFRSRSEQAFAIRSVEPSRARIDRLPSTEPMPELVSNLPVEITALHYLDGDGKAWRMPEGSLAGPGQRIPLEEAESPEAPGWIEETASRFSASQKRRVKGLVTQRNRYFAEVRDPGVFALPTHSSLRWQKTHLLLTGTPSGTNEPEADRP